MRSKKFENKYVIRIDPGEEIINVLSRFCHEESIKLGSVSAIGAVNIAEIGIFDTSTKVYHSELKEGTFEILALNGNITTQNDQPYLHLHITLCDNSFNAFGGHLNKAFVSATCEVVIEELDGKLNRYYDEKSGINLLEM